MLVHDLRERKPDGLLRELAAAPGLSFTYTSDPELFDAALAQRNHDFCLLLLDGDPPRELSDRLSRARLAHQLVGAASVHGTATAAGVREMLRLGMGEIYLEPVAPTRVIEGVRRRVEGAPIPAGAVQPTPSAACELHAFGRLGRVSLVHPAEFFVETDVELEVGADVVLTEPFVAAFGIPRVALRVIRKEERDLYYRYQHGYWLGQPADARILAAWPDFLQRFRADFVVPKPKVVWVTERPLREIERLISPATVSIQLLRPKHADVPHLTRIDPSLVVVDHASRSAHEAVTSWIVSTPGRSIVATSAAGSTSWVDAPTDPEGFDACVRAAATPPATGVRFLSRTSSISRCTLVIPGVLDRLGTGAFGVVTRTSTRVDSLVEVVGVPMSDRARLGIYGRVQAVEPGADHGGVRLVCEAIPVTDAAALSLTRVARGPVHEEEAPAAHPHVAPPTPSNGRWLVVVVAAAALLIGLGWAMFGRSSAEEDTRPANTRATLEGIRQAF